MLHVSWHCCICKGNQCAGVCQHQGGRRDRATHGKLQREDRGGGGNGTRVSHVYGLFHMHCIPTSLRSEQLQQLHCGLSPLESGIMEPVHLEIQSKASALFRLTSVGQSTALQCEPQCFPLLCIRGILCLSACSARTAWNSSNRGNEAAS